MSSIKGRIRLIRMPVPPVRPLLRRTMKRFLRLLPSFLLLLFVISLIFVTLMQIAVIHTQRRSLALQRLNSSGMMVSGNVSYGSIIDSLTATSSPSASSMQQAVKHHHPLLMMQPKNLLRIEALLDRTLPSVEANSKILQNYINAARIKQIINFAQNQKVSQPSHSPPNGNLMLTSDSDSFNSSSIYEMIAMGNISSPSYSPFFQLPPFANHHNALNDYKDSHMPIDASEFINNNSIKSSTNNYHNHMSLRWKRMRNHSNTDEIKSRAQHDHLSATMTSTTTKSLCPAVPPKLIGRIRVEAHPRIGKNMSEILKMNPDLRDGVGRYNTPSDCYARHLVGIIIPYRDRDEHLAILLYHLHPILQRQQLAYKIYVIEQFGNETFNKGVLMNVGVREALKETDYHCFVFHDVDLIPEDDRNLYSCPFSPRHMSVAVDKFNYTLPYPDLVGGVLSISKTHFILVNGYSNLYWGWGGEDDDMAQRLKYHNLQILRPPESIGRYTMIKHHHRPESPNNVRSALLRMARRRALRDGLGSVRYKVVSKRFDKLYTHLLVEIGHIHKWNFPTPNKLVLHF